MKILGIDPGLSGAYAFLTNAGATVGDLPVVGKAIDAAELHRIIYAERPDVAVVEAVSAMPGNGAVSMFNFGKSVGAIHAVLACVGVRTVLVTPSVWKKHFKLDRDKEKSRALAIRTFPQTTGLSRKRDDGRAEALLLALYHQETAKRAAT
jgi:hypothetical protein